MRKAKLIVSLLLAALVMFLQVGGVFAAPVLQHPTPFIGIVQSITLETDSTTGVTIVIVDLIDNSQLVQRVRVSQEKAIELGLVVLNEDGKPGINNLVLGKAVEIDPENVIPAQEESLHPVGNALATFFSDIEGVSYESIMSMHEQGIGFGVIAQTLWLTKQLDGDVEIFQTLVNAKQTGDYSAFILEDGTTPKNWGQLRKLILDKKSNLKIVKSIQENPENGSNTSNGNGMNGSGGGNDNGSGNNNGNGNNENKDKDKDKDKEKDKKK
jgi:hypothetical protein